MPNVFEERQDTAAPTPEEGAGPSPGPVAVPESGEDGPDPAPAQRSLPAPGLFREYAESALVTAVIFLFVTTFVVQAYKIPTGSMESNLLIGDHLLVNKFMFGQNGEPLGQGLPSREVRRGDVIVFKYPIDPTLAYVKRVVGLPGDRVEVDGHTVLVNGEAIEEPYTQFLYPSGGGRHGPVVVPANSYFAMGDNRDNSLDSRYWGFVPRDLIMGRAFLVYWSYETDREEYRRDSFQERTAQILDVAIHFFTKTRWQRTLQVVR